MWVVLKQALGCTLKSLAVAPCPSLSSLRPPPPSPHHLPPSLPTSLCRRRPRCAHTLPPGQAEGITEPRPSSLPESVLSELAPRIELADYPEIDEELIQDL